MGAYRHNQGFTLIELMITLALIGLVVAGGTSLYYFANRSFVSGSLMADIHANMQIAMRRITEQVRLAHSMKLMPVADVPTKIEDEDEHYLFAKNGSVILRTKEGGDRLILQGNSAGTGYTLQFSTVGEVANMLAVTLSSANPQVDYELHSELQVLNLRSGIEDKGTTAIRFTKTFSDEDYGTAEKIDPRCVFRRHVYHEGAPQLVHLREFRDNYLAKSPLGRAVIRGYYGASPIVSSFLDHQPVIRAVAKSFLRGVSEVIIKLS